MCTGKFQIKIHVDLGNLNQPTWFVIQDLPGVNFWIGFKNQDWKK
jgi:hypothetical protein